MVTNPIALQKTATASGLTGLARLIVRKGLLEESVLAQAMEQAKQQKIPFITHLAKQNLVNSLDVARLAAQEFGFPLFDLRAMDLKAAQIQLVAEDLIRHHRVLPLVKRGNKLFLALTDPTNLRALEDIKFHTGLNPEPVVATDDQLSDFIEKSLEHSSESISKLLDNDLEDIDIEIEDDDKARSDEDSTDAADDAPIVRYINQILLTAVTQGASDIHFEPYEHLYRIRFRQDGILHEFNHPPPGMAPRLAARLKVMAGLNIADRRIPQDGRTKMRLSKRRVVDMRVNTLPTLYGEKVVLRILDPAAAKVGADALGFEPKQKEQFFDAIHKPQGMVLVTGPTGSGKTVTLYTALNLLNSPDVNISTVEDPVEIQLPGVNQVNINNKAGLTFTGALRAFLRQDPDIIMLGEIRDLETAEIAVKAAQTGHMVLSTLHTNSAPQTLTRLLNMGVPAFNIASSVSLIIAQRLGRRLCEHCKALDDVPEAELLNQGFKEEQIDEIEIFHPVGCDKCTNGYKGRLGFFEALRASEAIGRIMMEGGNDIQIAEQAKREGMVTLRGSGLMKVIHGITSLAEVNRVTKD